MEQEEVSGPITFIRSIRTLRINSAKGKSSCSQTLLLSQCVLAIACSERNSNVATLASMLALIQNGFQRLSAHGCTIPSHVGFPKHSLRKTQVMPILWHYS